MSPSVHKGICGSLFEHKHGAGWLEPLFVHGDVLGDKVLLWDIGLVSRSASYGLYVCPAHFTVLSGRQNGMSTPGLWPGEFHGLYSPWGLRVRHDWVTFTFSKSIFCTLFKIWQCFHEGFIDDHCSSRKSGVFFSSGIFFFFGIWINILLSF